MLVPDLSSAKLWTWIFLSGSPPTLAICIMEILSECEFHHRKTETVHFYYCHYTNIFPHDTGKCFYYCVEDTWLEGISSYFNVDKEFLSLKFTSNVILKTFLHMYLFTILLILSDVWFWRLDFSREMQNLFFSVSSTLNSSKI